MGSTHRDTWKARERQAAALFGAKRQRCSGSSGRADLSRSDSTHPRLFLEVKLRAKFPFRPEFDLCRNLRLGKTMPPFGLNIARSDDLTGIAVVHSSDLDAALHFPAWILSLRLWSDAPNALRNLFRATEPLAEAERKIPVVLVATKGRPGFLVAFCIDDIDVIRSERYLALNGATYSDLDPTPNPGEAA